FRRPGAGAPEIFHLHARKAGEGGDGREGDGWPGGVRLPPGRARLATKPSSTGSVPMANTIGIVEVVLFAASVTALPREALTSTLRPTRSAAKARILS